MRSLLRLRLCASCVLALSLLGSFAAAQAATVTGIVTNKTDNKPAAGDDVVLIALAQGMQEAARTKTDASGHFSLDVPDNGMHLVRVDHEKAAYFEPLSPGTANLNIDVYDVAPKVAGVSTEADVMRIEAGPQGLQVVQSYFVKNESTPPKTQFSKASYEIYVQPDAKIVASAAMGPQGMPVSSSPIPTGEKGHYAFVFPIRPGETRFQLSYTLPYSGSYKFTPKIYLHAENVAVMLPKSMKFEGSAAFTPADVEASAQTFLAKGVQPSQDLTFTVSGTGSMPRDSEQAGANGAPGAPGAGGQPASADQAPAAAGDNRPGGGLGNPIDTPDPLQKYKWWILSGLAILLVIAAAFFLRGKPAAAVEAMPAPSPLSPTPAFAAVPKTAVSGREGMLAALKDELFALETERLEGKISDAEYADLKAALEVVLRRALGRQPVA